ncbi:hypothetical protein ACFVKB_45605 [Rhodococcus sp. NPDC127530]|uniref:hypothetical protein n=1 Tax=unclassified Rhodococcus (in: high G+C Gram-positive bacteria) TaxID=192944 RepID=UPI00362E501A
MAPNETARSNHHRLFPELTSALSDTDPELIDYFDNFAFDEVIAQSDLDERTRLVVQLVVCLANNS